MQNTQPESAPPRSQKSGIVNQLIGSIQSLITVAQYPQKPRTILEAMKKTLLGLVLLFCFAVPYAAQAQVVIVVHHRHHHHRHHYPHTNLNQ